MVERKFSLDGSGELDATGAGGTIDGELGAVSFDTGNSSEPGDVGGDDFTFDPERHIGIDRTNADGSYRRKRKRKGGGNSESRATAAPRSKTKADHSASIDALTNTLIIVHAGLASVTKIKELEIDPTEGKSLAVALANVLAEFDIQPDPKVQAIVGLVVAGASIYGPRMYLYNERMKAEKAKRVPQNFQVVT